MIYAAYCAILHLRSETLYYNLGEILSQIFELKFPEAAKRRDPSYRVEEFRKVCYWIRKHNVTHLCVINRDVAQVLLDGLFTPTEFWIQTELRQWLFISKSGLCCARLPPSAEFVRVPVSLIREALKKKPGIVKVLQDLHMIPQKKTNKGDIDEQENEE